MLFVHRAPRLPFVAAGDDACCPQRFSQRVFVLHRVACDFASAGAVIYGDSRGPGAYSAMEYALEYAATL